MAVIANERSYSSSATYYKLNSFSADRNGSTLTVTISLTIQGGPSSSLGTGSSRIRKCYMYDGSGSAFSGTYTLKDSGTSWGNNFKKTWSITFTKNIGYDYWSSNCYLRIGPDENWNSAPSPDSFWWNGKKAGGEGTVGQTFLISLNSTEGKPIVTAPTAQSVNAGETATFDIIASDGQPPIYTYQWQQSTNNGSSYSNMVGKNSRILSLTATPDMNGYYYRCAVSNDAGTTYSSGALLTVFYPMTLNPGYPEDKTINNGEKATLSISFSDEGSPAQHTYQWYKNDSAISNATSSSYTTPTLYTEDSGNTYYCIVKHTKTGKTAKSRVATITVLGYKPTSTNPVNTKVNNGDNVDFTVKITVGNPASTVCQWQMSLDGGNTYENIGTETTLTESDYTTLSLLAVSYAEYNGAKIRISATNTAGTHYSNDATLTINRKPNEPTLIFPKPNTTTYNKKPFGLFQWGTDLDGDSMLGYIAIGGVIYRSDSNSWYNGGAKTTAERSLVKFDKNNFTNNHYDITAYTNDGMIDSNHVNSNITISDPNFTDTIQRNVPIKAIHISELRSKINNLENYYGLDITTWSDTITSGSTIKAIHIEELRTAINTIKTYLNSFGANISISWTDSSLKDKLIKAVHINEIRNAITKL